MSPINQSQFIPLGEVLLVAVSALNSAHKSVTQESLIEHLQTCFPGMSSSEISIGWLLMYAYNYIFTVTSQKN